MRPIDDERLAEIVRRLVKAYRPEHIYLFGAMARGDVGADSDYDILIVAPDNAPEARRRSRLAYQVLRGALFHCQQAAEKALKGFLAWHDVPFRKTHNLEEIGETCLSVDLSLQEIVGRSVPLTEYAWKFRYPGELEELTRREAEEAIALAREVYDAIPERLPAELHP